MRIAESDDEVRQNIPLELVPLFNRVRTGIKKTHGESRTEAFLRYVEEHPGEEIAAVERVADFRLESVLRPMLDFYETPSWAVRAVAPLLPVVPEQTRIVDAGCGTGAILRELGAIFPENELLGIEKDEARFEACRESTDLPVERGDFLLRSEPCDLVVSNPPYVIAFDFVAHALTLAPVVAMLLRLGWLAGQKRAEWHRENPAHVCVLPRRPSFTGDDKTDATEYAWFIWGTADAGKWTVLDVEPRKRKGRR